MLSEIIGGEDTMGARADKAKEIGATAAKVGKTAAAFTGVGGAVMKAGSLTSKAVGAGKLAKNAYMKTAANEGTGRYKKGSASYDNAVTNMADNVTDDEILTQAAASTVSDEDAIKWLGSDKKALSNYGKKHGIDKIKPGESEQAIWGKMSDKEKAEFKQEFASRNVSNMSNEQKEETLAGLKSTGKIEEFRKGAAENKLDNMDWRDRQGVIDANHRGRGQNERIRNRAIAAAGGEEAYRNMSSEDRNALFNDSKHGNWQNPLGKSLEKGVSDKSRRTSSIDGAKIELGESTLKALSKSFVDFGKQIGSFAQHTMGAMSGPMMGEMKGLGGDMIQIAQGKLKKELDLASEMKNQKKLRTAQNMAEESLGLGGANQRQAEPPEKPRPTELSDASVRKIASALQSNSDKTSSVKLDDTSINKIGSAIAEKLNKKD